MQDDTTTQVSSGNVFADIKMSNPGERLQKAELARQVAETIAIKNINSERACQVLGIDNKRFSDLTIGRLTNFSLSELADFAARL